jgi:hypothetical protein
MFGAPIHDVSCGMRGFTMALTERLDQRHAGEETVSETVIEAVPREMRRPRTC